MSIMDAERSVFIYGNQSSRTEDEALVPGCLANGILKEAAEAIWNKMVEFAKYAFNRSHAVAYTRLSMETAYLKKHYPYIFMASTISSVQANNEKIRHFCNLAQKNLHMTILPPDVNRSFPGFYAEKNAMRFGLACIKDVGMNIARSIAAERQKNGEYQDLYDFTSRLLPAGLKKNTLEALIKAGAFDWYKQNRAEMLASVGVVFEAAKSYGANGKGQKSIFSLIPKGSTYLCPSLKEALPMKDEEMLHFEREVLSIYLSGSPLESCRRSLHTAKNAGVLPVQTLFEQCKAGTLGNQQQIAAAGVLFDLQRRTTRKKTTLMRGKLQDDDAEMEIVFFDSVLERYAPVLHNDEKVVLTGNAEIKEDGTCSLRVNHVIRMRCDAESEKEHAAFIREIDTALKRKKESKHKGCALQPESGKDGCYQPGIYLRMAKTADLNHFAAVLHNLNGDLPIYICDVEQGRIMRHPDWKAGCDQASLGILQDLCGADGVKLFA